jgi:hypothetical protein
MYTVYEISNPVHKSRKAVHFRKLSFIRSAQFCNSSSLKIWMAAADVEVGQAVDVKRALWRVD